MKSQSRTHTHSSKKLCGVFSLFSHPFLRAMRLLLGESHPIAWFSLSKEGRVELACLQWGCLVSVAPDLSSDKNGSMVWISSWKPLKAVEGVVACEICKKIRDPQETESKSSNRGTHRTSKMCRRSRERLRKLKKCKRDYVYESTGKENQTHRHRKDPCPEQKRSLALLMGWLVVLHCMEPICKNVCVCV